MKLSDSMKQLLAETFAMYLKAHSFHWNVTGPDFYQYHAFFKDIYTELWAAVDLIAEEIRQLNEFVPGSLERFSKLAKAAPTASVPTTEIMISSLRSSNNEVRDCLKECYVKAETAKFYGLANFLQDRMMAHNKLEWMLSSSER